MTFFRFLLFPSFARLFSIFLGILQKIVVEIIHGGPLKTGAAEDANNGGGKSCLLREIHVIQLRGVHVESIRRE